MRDFLALRRWGHLLSSYLHACSENISIRTYMVDHFFQGAKVEVELFASLNYTKKMDVDLY